MILDENKAYKTAELLLQINAIKLNPQKPFTWASGIKSPIYCDNRIVLSYPTIRNYIVSELAKPIETLFGKPDAIAGVATGAIGIGAIIADYLGLPFVYVRPEPKKHGRQNQIEGKLNPHANVVVIEDLISTGKSSMNAVKALKDEGQAHVKGMMAIFTYGFEESETLFKDEYLDVYTLSNYKILLKKAYNTNYLNETEFELLKTWRKDPANWKH
ncbi:orotate phosphoribosyltransferase [Psychroflexus salinarum]|uniref:Orotate phosphoribosyltransferase n=1 Tax=Psychroflexus salinarum TaxID=546024 RepID=A0ABW3GX67_9FLAO